MARILVVDDNDRIVALFSALLQMAKHEVTTALDGDEALPLLEKSSFDLIVTDLEMTRMNGDEFSRLVKEKFPNLPILMVTGSVPPKDCQADHVMSKAFENVEFLAHVERMLKK